jgi:hypothetical protein
VSTFPIRLRCGGCSIEGEDLLLRAAHPAG